MSKLEHNEWANSASSKKKTGGRVIERIVHQEIEKRVTKAVGRNNSNAVEVQLMGKVNGKELVRKSRNRISQFYKLWNHWCT